MFISRLLDLTDIENVIKDPNEMVKLLIVK